tara:strand:- start:8952 stop:9185 length:234 start_codon:yes stop_codon:yes gene_type:complete
MFINVTGIWINASTVKAARVVNKEVRLLIDIADNGNEKNITVECQSPEDAQTICTHFINEANYVPTERNLNSDYSGN